MCQLFVVYGRFFVTSWDVRLLFYPQLDPIVYFSSYVNNILYKGLIDLARLYVAVPFLDFFRNTIPILSSASSYDVTYYIFVIFNCISTTLVCCMLSLITKKYFSQTVAIFSFIFLAFFLGLNQWILVPYTDTYSMFFITCILFSYIFVSNRSLKWSLIVFLTIVGFNIKPYVIFAFLSIVFISLISVKKFKITKSIFKPMLSILVSCFLAFGICILGKNASNIRVNAERQFSATHYLMMGLNHDSEGFYNDDDVMYSRSFDTLAKREKGNMDKISEEINEMQIGGLVFLFAKKIQANFGDGTFMWGKDGNGNFYSKRFGDNAVVNLIYNNISPFSNLLWFMVLLGGIFIIKHSEYNKCFYILCLTLLMHGIFLTIFECGSRYLIIYLPYYFLLSLYGWKHYYNWFLGRRLIKRFIK